MSVTSWLTSKVKNWQIRREMGYPYEESRPEKQIAYVFDINKCIACQTCTVACKTTWTSGKGQEIMFWNNVETKPYGGYPIKWDLNILKSLDGQSWDKEGKYNGKTVFEAAPPGERVLGWLPEEEDYSYPNIGEDECAGIVEKGAFFSGIHKVWMFYLARICNHCTYPACLAACPRKAIYKRKEDGIVLIDQSRCRGYRECVRACPYKRTFFNLVTRISEKCIGCYPLIEKGEQPRCVQTCIGKIRLQGFLSKPDSPQKDNPLDFLVYVKKVALPLYPQFGLEPNVYYIPPIHVPKEFLYQMFGPGVDKAIETYKGAKDDKELLGAFLLFGSTDKIIRSFKVEGDYALGFNDKGEMIAKVPFKEPVYIRPYFDKKVGTYRHNIP
ncbi:MAG: respiratory nitrate reductase beta chain [Candidatus Dadabacteria bacterium]|jgi:nitrate reductase beta subunit|nr:respiratory nitrate reductase beta chain [Candidatus Dadabacteria bacterium]OGE23651.1 MAG: dehydrogenase [Candidatus Dadabacteria bacterium RBG_19FT_COMBO_40_33]